VGMNIVAPMITPQRPTGRREAGITAVAGWRSKKIGQHSNSLWKSTITAKGTPAKNSRYYKWSGRKSRVGQFNQCQSYEYFQ